MLVLLVPTSLAPNSYLSRHAKVPAVPPPTLGLGLPA